MVISAMNEELPEPLARWTPPSAPGALRGRVLSAVAGELAARGKPRWERLLELGVAATFVLGVVLNGELIAGAVQGFAASRELANVRSTRGVQVARESERDEMWPEAFEKYYTRYLAGLSANNPG